MVKRVIAIKMRRYVDVINKVKSPMPMREMLMFPTKNSSYKLDAPSLINMYNVKIIFTHAHRKEASTAKLFFSIKTKRQKIYNKTDILSYTQI